MSYPKQTPGNYPAPGQYPPPGAPGQYPPSGAPGQYPPPGAPGQYPPPGAPGQYPPSGAPGQYPPPGAPGQYPPPGAPGQYPPPGAPGQYPPPGAPGQYPPPGAPGQYPPPGAPGQYPPPGAPGQYPPPGAPGQYPPPGGPGQYPPSGAPGQYPPPGAPGQYPPPGGHPPQGHPPHGHPVPGGPSGWDADDSDSENYVRSKDGKYPVKVKFINKTNQKVKLYWVDYKGKFKKSEKLKEGRIEFVVSYAGHPFLAETNKGGDAVINGNMMFFVDTGPGGHGEVKAEITNGPKDIKQLRSSQTGHPVRLKFSNRTHSHATVQLVDPQGQRRQLKDIAPKKAWVFDTYEGQYFVAHEKGRPKEELDLNNGWFWMATKPVNPQRVQKILLTEAHDDSSSSSSSSD